MSNSRVCSWILSSVFGALLLVSCCCCSCSCQTIEFCHLNLQKNILVAETPHQCCKSFKQSSAEHLGTSPSFKKNSRVPERRWQALQCCNSCKQSSAEHLGTSPSFKKNSRVAERHWQAHQCCKSFKQALSRFVVSNDRDLQFAASKKHFCRRDSRKHTSVVKAPKQTLFRFIKHARSPMNLPNHLISVAEAPESTPMWRKLQTSTFSILHVKR